jgi:hypothetical protein
MLLLKELIRLSSQHRTFYCYLLLSIWIFLLIAGLNKISIIFDNGIFLTNGILGMYKYINSTENMTSFLNSKSFYTNKLSEKDEDRLKIQKYYQDFCNPAENIIQGEEGGLIENFHLQGTFDYFQKILHLQIFKLLLGVLLLIRHGTRAPLVHVKGINSIDCSHENDVLLNKYKTFLLNATTTSGPNNYGHASWMKQGPFHGFPLLPANPKSCLLGQLTYRGLSQLLHIGEILKSAYAHSLELYRKPIALSKSNNSEQSKLLNPEDIIVYSTRYRRTFQSAMALLYSFLPLDRWHNLQIRESHSLSFCFSDCACQNAEYLKKKLSKESSKSITKNPTISLLVQWIGTKLLQNSETQNPLDIRDALLTYMCHGIDFPCFKIPSRTSKLDNYFDTTIQSETDNADVINIDGDFNHNSNNFQDDIVLPDSGSDEENVVTNEVNDGCVEHRHVDTLFSFTNKYSLEESQNKRMQHQRLLRAYGLLRNMVYYMLKMISGEKIKFIFYSCHDKTLEYLLSTLGTFLDSAFIPYAARLSFEVYRSDKDTQYYFRLVYNGHDLTKSVSFCEGSKSLRVKRGRVGHADLCPIENIIRFIHDDYFLELNATNFKDACAKEPQKENYF